MKNYIMDLIEAKQIYKVFFKRISDNKLRKMQENLNGIPKKKYLFSNKYNKGFWIKKIDLRKSKCHCSRRCWSNGLNYMRRRNGKKKLKIMLFFCYNNCGSKFLGYFNGKNQRQYCKKCYNNQTIINEE